MPESFNLERDRVHWGAVWAGLLTAITSLVLLNVLGLAIGLTMNTTGAAQPGPDLLQPGAGQAAAIWAAVVGIVSFMIGGYVVGRSAAIFSRGWAAWNGALVFILAFPVTLLLAGMGLGGLLGTVGNLVSGLAGTAMTPGAFPGAPGAIQQPTPEQIAAAAATVRDAAWGTLIGGVLALGAAAIGGALGARRTITVEGDAGRVERVT